MMGASASWKAPKSIAACVSHRQKVDDDSTEEVEAGELPVHGLGFIATPWKAEMKKKERRRKGVGRSREKEKWKGKGREGKGGARGEGR